MFTVVKWKASLLFAAIICVILSGNAFGGDLFSVMGVIKPKTRIEPPEFTLASINGKKIELQEFRGKVILLNFWATWCGPCRDEMPALEKLEKNFNNQDFVVVAIAADRGKKAMHIVQDYCKMHKISFTVLLDPDGSVRKTYEVSALPTSYIIGRDWRFSGKILGARDWAGSDSLKLFENLLKE